MTRRFVTFAAVFILSTAAAFAQSTGYDRSTVTSVTGTIRYVISVQGPDGTVGVHLELTTPDGPVRVHLGPAMFIGMNNFSFITDEVVAVTGSEVGKGPDAAIWARSITKDGKTLTLRNEDGTARWPKASAEDPDGCGVSHAPIR